MTKKEKKYAFIEKVEKLLREKYKHTQYEIENGVSMESYDDFYDLFASGMTTEEKVAKELSEELKSAEEMGGGGKAGKKKKNIWEALDFENIEQYYDYIDESRVNGNFSQVRDLVDDMTDDQRKGFFRYAREMGYNETVNWINEKMEKGGKAGAKKKSAKKYTDKFEEIYDWSSRVGYAKDFGSVIMSDRDGENDTKIPLLVVAKILDIYDATGDEQFKDTPFSVSFEIAPYPEFVDEKHYDGVRSSSGIDSEDKDVLFADLMEGYMGGVPILNDKLEELFKTQEEAEAYIKSKEVADILGGIEVMIGFYLDGSINRIGDSRWSYLIKMVDEDGKRFVYSKGGKAGAKTMVAEAMYRDADNYKTTLVLAIPHGLKIKAGDDVDVKKFGIAKDEWRDFISNTMMGEGWRDDRDHYEVEIMSVREMKDDDMPVNSTFEKGGKAGKKKNPAKKYTDKFEEIYDWSSRIGYAKDFGSVIMSDREGENETKIPLIVVAKILDIYDATGDEQFKDTPFELSFEIAPYPEYIDEKHYDGVRQSSGIDSQDKDALFADLMEGYMGGVPILNDELQVLFKTQEEVETYIKSKKVADILKGIEVMVGFYLDGAINRIGEPRWKFLIRMVDEDGKRFVYSKGGKVQSGGGSGFWSNYANDGLLITGGSIFPSRHDFGGTLLGGLFGLGAGYIWGSTSKQKGYPKRIAAEGDKYYRWDDHKGWVEFTGEEYHALTGGNLYKYNAKEGYYALKIFEKGGSVSEIKGYGLEDADAIRDFKFDEHFTIVPPHEDKVKEGMYALDLRDGSDFLIDSSHNIAKLIGTGDFAFGIERSEKGGKAGNVSYNVSYFDKDGELIDSTQIDEKDEKLAWELFEEFGHKKEKGTYLEFEEVEVGEDEMGKGGSVHSKKYGLKKVSMTKRGKGIDSKVKAKPAGWRKSEKTGDWYFEARANRADKSRRSKL